LKASLGFLARVFLLPLALIAGFGKFPGFLETEMTHGLDGDQKGQIVRRTPAGRLGEPRDVVPLIRFLCSEEAGFITGQTICVDGGLTA
jgi:3-oxoacyl-[acyl-carrier protein] reductase